MKALRVSLWLVSIVVLALALGAFIGATETGSKQGAAYGVISWVMLGVLGVLAEGE